MNQEWEKDINKWIREACADNGCPELADEIRFEWGNQKSSMGTAYYNQKRIRLSLPYWRNVGEDERRNTTKHEVCHIVSRKLYGYQGRGHGRLWKQTMVKAGEEPTRCHSNGVAEGVKAWCDCKEWSISTRRAAKMKRGASYTCRFCGATLRFEKEPPEG